MLRVGCRPVGSAVRITWEGRTMLIIIPAQPAGTDRRGPQERPRLGLQRRLRRSNARDTRIVPSLKIGPVRIRRRFRASRRRRPQRPPTPEQSCTQGLLAQELVNFLRAGNRDGRLKEGHTSLITIPGLPRGLIHDASSISGCTAARTTRMVASNSSPSHNLGPCRVVGK